MIKKPVSIAEQKAKLKDAGRRRHLSWGMEFDSRAYLLSEGVKEHWDDNVKSQHLHNLDNLKKALIYEFGEFAAELKQNNFADISTKPFSVIAHHNVFFDQVRRSFVLGAYYPSLVGACALGERILNHLILDLRGYFCSTPEYKRISRKKSFDNWQIPIDTLSAWNILLPGVATEFQDLMRLRHRSIHFNPITSGNLRSDALAAILHLRTIIEHQFGSFGRQPWFISGTKGHCFIRKDFETHPFVQVYLIPRCPFVGPLFGMSHHQDGWRFHDLPDYGPGTWSDEEFAEAYNNRDLSEVVKPPDEGEFA